MLYTTDGAVKCLGSDEGVMLVNPLNLTSQTRHTNCNNLSVVLGNTVDVPRHSVCVAVVLFCTILSEYLQYYCLWARDSIWCFKFLNMNAGDISKVNQFFRQKNDLFSNIVSFELHTCHLKIMHCFRCFVC